MTTTSTTTIIAIETPIKGVKTFVISISTLLCRMLSLLTALDNNYTHPSNNMLRHYYYSECKNPKQPTIKEKTWLTQTTHNLPHIC